MKNKSNWFVILLSGLILIAVSACTPLPFTGDEVSSQVNPGLITYNDAPFGRVGANLEGLKDSIDFETGDPHVLLQAPEGDKVVFGGSFVLEEGEVLDGSLVVIGGVADLKTNSHVMGDLVLMGGSLNVLGEIEGDIVIIGGLLNLQTTAVVAGDVVSLGGRVERQDGAQIWGELMEQNWQAWSWTLPKSASMPAIDFEFGLLWKLFWYVLRSLMWAVLALLIMLFFPQQTEVVSKAIVSQPIAAGGFGIITAFVAPFLLILISLTIIGIPLTLLLVFGLLSAWCFGIIAFGTEVGKRLRRSLNVSWSPALQSGVGTLLLTAVINGIGLVIPCVGWLIPFVVGAIGLGAVMLTVFGSRDYPPRISSEISDGSTNNNLLPDEASQEGDPTSSEDIQQEEI